MEEQAEDAEVEDKAYGHGQEAEQRVAREYIEERHGGERVVDAIGVNWGDIELVPSVSSLRKFSHQSKAYLPSFHQSGVV